MANVDPKDLVLTKKTEEKKYFGVVKGPKGDSVEKIEMIRDYTAIPHSYKLKVYWSNGTSQILNDKWYDGKDGKDGESGINKVFGDDGSALKDISIQKPWYLTNLQEPTNDQMPVTLGYLNKNLWIKGEYKYVDIGTHMPPGWIKIKTNVGYSRSLFLSADEDNDVKEELDITVYQGASGDTESTIQARSPRGPLYSNSLHSINCELWQYNPSKYEEIIKLGMTPREYAAKEKIFIKNNLTFDKK